MLNYDVVAEGLVRYTNWFCRFGGWEMGMTFTMEACFEEAYEIMAGIRVDKVLGIGRFRDVAHSFCDKVLEYQGQMEKDMYYMGYGNVKNEAGIPACSCIADCSSVANALAETVVAYPDYDKNAKYIESMKRFADYVLDTYVTPEGVIGVGILGYRINPMVVYWCANTLFGKFLIKLGEITGEDKYLDAAVGAMDFIATFDYRETRWKEWNTSSTMMILYTGEGLLEGLLSKAMRSRLDKPSRYLGNPANAPKPAAQPELAQADNRVYAEKGAQAIAENESVYALLKARWTEFAAWLIDNQEMNGMFMQKSERSYLTYDPGISWLAYKSFKEFDHDPRMENVVKRQLSMLTRNSSKPILGLFCNPFPTALAHLSFASVATYLSEEDPDAFAQAVDEAMEYTKEMYW